MKEIELTRGLKTIVDDEDYALINANKWRAIREAVGYEYAARRIFQGTGKPQKILLLHRFILNAPKGMVVDHINGNTLDNRRENLRLCSHAENMRNRKINRANTTGFKGVRVVKSYKNGPRYKAEITVNNRTTHIGYFRNPIEAAHAYDDAALSYFKSFAKTNF